MLLMRRREALALLAGSLASAASRLPANKNVRWAVSANLWNHFQKVPFTDILDVMRDTGFIGVRMTQFPAILDTYGLTIAQMQKEMEKRNLHVATISFNGPAQDPAQQKKVLADAKRAMEFLAVFGAKHLVIFSPSRTLPGANTESGFKTMCETFNHIGELANEMGFRAGLHNHLDQMVEQPAELAKCMAMTDPKLFWFSPDSAHLHLAGHNVVEVMSRYKDRLMFADYKDAKWTTPVADVVLDNGKVHPKDSKNARFFDSIYDLGDGEIDFPGCHRVLKSIAYKGWICVDLDRARKGPRASYERCGAYVVNKLEPIYV
jgi:sugar phosphate isomerase/epimerase